MIPRQAIRAVAATALSAALCVLTVHPFDLWPLAPVCLAPLIVAIARASVLRGAALGLLHGVLMNALAFHWIGAAFQDVAGMLTLGAWGMLATFALLQGARTAVTTALGTLGARCGVPIAIGYPIATVAAELGYPLALRWRVGLFAVGFTPWIQLAELGGTLALSFWISGVAAMLACAWLSDRGVERSRWLVGAAAILATVTAFGYRRAGTIERESIQAPSVRLGAVQADLGPVRLETRDSVAAYRNLSQTLLQEHPDLDLLVWPETAASRPVRESQLGPFVATEIAGGLAGDAPSPPLLLGVVMEGDPTLGEHARHGNGKLTNSAVLAGPRGKVLGRYDKRERVPIGERSLDLGLFEVRAATEFEPGELRPALVLDGHRLSVSICYEDILDDAFRNSVKRQQPELLVNLTSDAWFRDSAGPDLHLELASLRAVEFRRFLLRATTTGVTSLVSPTGRVTWQLPVGRPATGVVDAHWLNGVTPYERFGDRPWVALLLASLAFVTVHRVGREREARQRP